MKRKTVRTVKEFIEKARAAGHDALGIANDPEAIEALDKVVQQRTGGPLKSVTLRASEKRMYEWSKGLTASNERFNHWVVIQHDEGTQYLFVNAFLVNDPEDEYVWAITEHQGYHVFSKDELAAFVELVRYEDK